MNQIITKLGQSRKQFIISHGLYFGVNIYKNNMFLITASKIVELKKINKNNL